MQLAIRSMAASAILFISGTSAVTASPGLGGPDKGPLEYQIAPWYRFKSAALSISFDDNYRSQVTHARPVLNQYNYKATYYIVTNRVGYGWAPDWDTVNMLAQEGNEIGSHSKNHANFEILEQNPLFADSMMHEFRDSRDTINRHVPYKHCETFAWPGGNTGVASGEMSKKYYMACRGSNNNFEFPDPLNFFNLASQHIYHDTPLETVNGYVDTVLNRKGWLIERWHGFRINNDTNGYEPVPIEIFSQHFSHVAWSGNELWVAPVGTVAKYLIEREASSLKLLDSTGLKVVFDLTNNLSDSLTEYNQPLSIKVRAYGKMARTKLITQDKDTVSFCLVQEDSLSFISFNAVPNHGQLKFHLIHEVSGTSDNNNLKRPAYNYPNPFKESTTIRFELASEETVTLCLYDELGHIVKSFSLQGHSGMNSTELAAGSICPGVYTCSISGREVTMNLRLVLVP